MLEKLGNTKTARKSLKVRKTECSSASTAEICLILNEKVIEEICEMYFKTMNSRFEVIEKKLDAKCDSKEGKEIVRQEMDAIHTCRPNDDESRNLLTTKNVGIVVEETVREIN